MQVTKMHVPLKECWENLGILINGKTCEMGVQTILLWHKGVRRTILSPSCHHRRSRGRHGIIHKLEADDRHPEGEDIRNFRHEVSRSVDIVHRMGNIQSTRWNIGESTEIYAIYYRKVRIREFHRNPDPKESESGHYTLKRRCDSDIE